MADLTVRLQALDGVWEVCGRDRYPDVLPDSFTATADPWGPASCSFQLKRPADNQYPDLFALTPCEVEIGGVVVWDGRIKETPVSEASQSISVVGEGRQFELDDDQFERDYVQTDLAKFRDARSFATADLSRVGTAAGSINQDASGAMVMQWPKGSQLGGGSPYLGVVADCGPDPGRWPQVVAFTHEVVSMAPGAFTLRLRNSAAENVAGVAGEDPWVITDSGTTAPATIFAAFTTPRRYVGFFVFYPGGVVTIGEDEIWRISACRMFTAAAYESGSASALRASDVVLDAVARGAPNLVLPAKAASARWVDEALGTPGVYGLWRLRETAGAVARDAVAASGGSSPQDMAIVGTGTTLGGASLLQGDPGSGSFHFNGSGGLQQVFPGPLPFPDRLTWSAEVVFTPDAASFATSYRNLFYLGSAAGTVAGAIGVGFGDGAGGAGALLTVLFETVAFTNPSAALSIPAFVAGRTYHMIVARGHGSTPGSAGQFWFWINGVLYGPWNSAQDPGAFPTASLNVAVNPAAAGRNFVGTVDEFLLSTVAVTSQALATAKYQAALNRQAGAVQRTAFNLPDLAIDGAQTSRTFVDAVNAFHRWRSRVMPGGVVRFEPQPLSPIYEVGAWSGSQFEDAAAGSADDVYNKVIVEGSGPDGAPIRATVYPPSAAPNFVNPSADVDVSGWTQMSGPVTRDTTVFDTSPASFKLVNDVSAYSDMSQNSPIPLVPGRRYTVTLAVRPQGVAGWFLQVTMQAGGKQFGKTFSGNSVLPVGVWSTISVDLTYPGAVQATGSLLISMASIGAAGTYVGNVDSIVFRDYSGTIPDRRGIVKCKTLTAQSALTQVAAQRVGQAYLDVHRKTPARGSLKVTGQDGVRRVMTGENVHPSEMLLATTELVRLSHRVDPDTGGQGRDGTIAQVSYSHADESATVAIDSTRTSFEALLARMAVLTR